MRIITSLCLLFSFSCSASQAIETQEKKDYEYFYVIHSPVLHWPPQRCTNGANTEDYKNLCEEGSCVIGVGVYDNRKSGVISYLNKGELPYFESSQNITHIYEDDKAICVSDESNIYCYVWLDLFYGPDEICPKIIGINSRSSGDSGRER